MGGVRPARVAMADARAWERDCQDWEWSSDDGEPADSDIEDWDADACSADEAGEHLFDQITRLKLSGKLSAVQACTLAFWACKAGRQQHTFNI